MKEEQIGKILAYQSKEGNTKIQFRLENENVWFIQKMMEELFQAAH